jgi:glyoxylase-like metal-dependent hydrolase (beta-lactamase superfamily II)
MSASASDTGVQLSVILTAELPTPRNYVFRPSGNRVSQLQQGLKRGDDALIAPSLAFVAQHPTAGTIVIDTGFHGDVRRNLRGDFGTAMSLLFKDIRPAVKPFDQQLRELDIDPAGVERVLMTHLHVDHTSGMRLLPNARFTCASAEWAATKMRFASRAGYVRHHLPEAARVDLIDFAGTGPHSPYGPFERSLDLLGDGSIRLLYTPGHTKGHVSILLRLEDGNEVLLVGDAAYTLRNIRDVILPLLTADDDASLRTLRALNTFAEQNPDVTLVPSHDPIAWQGLRRIATVEETECAA